MAWASDGKVSIVAEERVQIPTRMERDVGVAECGWVALTWMRHRADGVGGDATLQIADRVGGGGTSVSDGTAEVVASDCECGTVWEHLDERSQTHSAWGYSGKRRRARRVRQGEQVWDKTPKTKDHEHKQAKSQV